MSVSVDDRGSCKRVARRLHAEAHDFPKDMNDASVKVAEKVKREIQRTAASILPRRGGLASEVSRMDIAIGKQAHGVRLTAKSKFNVARIDQGTVTHPVYGNRSVTVAQSVNPGFWTKPTQDSKSDFDHEYEQALQRTARRIEKG